MFENERFLSHPDGDYAPAATFRIVPSTIPLHCSECGQCFMQWIDDYAGRMITSDELPICADCAEELCPELLNSLHEVCSEGEEPHVQHCATGRSPDKVHVEPPREP